MYNAMLQKKEVLIDGISFFIAPFPVFTSARITAMLGKVLAPVIGGVVALLGSDDDVGGGGLDADETTLHQEAMEAIPAFTSAMEGLSPAAFETLMRELLVNSRNIAWKDQEHMDCEILTEDALNALFAGKTQHMYILAYHVLKNNFTGFFTSIRNQYGDRITEFLKKKTESSGTANLTPASSMTLS